MMVRLKNSTTHCSRVFLYFFVVAYFPPDPVTCFAHFIPRAMGCFVNLGRSLGWDGMRRLMWTNAFLPCLPAHYMGSIMCPSARVSDIENGFLLALHVAENTVSIIPFRFPSLNAARKERNNILSLKLSEFC